ncbi:MAG: ABC transporter permease [Oculatellaceae cyanobacterium bins.114]|nr:ABC transporter permease [Oculatellaceae cyanobacterium bins.114]
MTNPISETRSPPLKLPSQASLLKYIGLAPAVIYDAVFFLLPLLFLIWIGFWTTENYRAVPGFSLENYSDIFSQFLTRSRYAFAILQSFWVAVTTTALGILVCYPFAMVLAFVVPERYQRFFLVLAIAPFWTSYILRLYAWQTIINTNGLLNTLLLKLHWIDTPLQIIFTQWGTRLGLLHYLAPIMILILYLVLRNSDRSLIEAARNLGATRWQTFCRVILPLSRLGIIYSAIFGLIISLGDVLSGIILGGGTGQSILGKFPLFSSMILNEYAASTNLPRTSALATILILIMMIILIAGFKLSESEQ